MCVQVTRCTSRSLCLPIQSSLSEAEAVTSAELDMVTPPEVEEELSQATLIWRAVKLPLYSVAFIPLTVGNISIILGFSYLFQSYEKRVTIGKVDFNVGG